VISSSSTGAEASERDSGPWPIHALFTAEQRIRPGTHLQRPHSDRAG
jgi:hypothetical protein